MRELRNCYTVIVRVKGREFFYWKDSIIGRLPELVDLGFNYDKEEDEYIRVVEESEIDSAYRVKCNYGIYKGFQVRVTDYKEKEGEIFVMFDNDSEGEAAGIKPRIDYNDKCMRYYEAYVPESEVTDVYEVREAVEGFPFVSPKIVYHKKDGVWLPWHEYGTPLKDGEWI